MNGRYDLSETSSASNTSKYPDYRDYPGGAGYFDVYSPLITQRYSQVWWQPLPPVELPEDIVSMFDGRTMAVVGFEVDQVMRKPEGDVSVVSQACARCRLASVAIIKKGDGGEQHAKPSHLP